jgi:hypothetical protein
MEKTKRKRGEISPLSWLWSLYRPLPFDFESPLVLEDCAARLKSLHNGPCQFWTIIPTGNVQVSLTPVSATANKFVIHKCFDRNYYVEANGYLKDQPDLTTIVIGEARIPNLIMAVMLLPFLPSPFLLVAGAIKFMSGVNVAAATVLFLGTWATLLALTGITVLRHSFNERNELLSMIERVLSDSTNDSE